MAITLAAMAADYTQCDFDELPEWLRSACEGLTAEERQMMLQAMTAMAVYEDQQEQQTRLEVPAPPSVDDRELVTELLYPGRDLDAEPLPADRAGEIDALLGAPNPNRGFYPSSYNQPVRMLTLAETAAELGLGMARVRRMARGGGLPALRMFGTIRIRSDYVWAMGNILAAGLPAELGCGWATDRPRGALDRGVPVEQVARTLRVHPQTMWRWWRKLAKANPDVKPRHLLWRCVGRRERAMIPEDILMVWGIPYEKSSLRRIYFEEAYRIDAEVRAAIAENRRRTNGVAPGLLRRKNKMIRDQVSGLQCFTMADAASMMGISASGTRKALQRGGAITWTIAGTTRVCQDDLFAVLQLRSDKVRKSRGLPPGGLMKDPLLVPIAMAADKIGVTVRTLRRRAAAGKLEIVTSGSKLWLRRHEVDALVAAQAAKPARAAEARDRRRAAAERGANLTEAHVENFLAWLKWSQPDIDPAMALHTRSSAATFAGTRPNVIEALVAEGLLPAQRRGRDLRIRTVDLVAAGVFSAKVARMCPKLRIDDPRQRRNVTAEYLTFDQAAQIVERPASEVRYLARIGTLHEVRFGSGNHRLHESEVYGPGLVRYRQAARPYRTIEHKRFGGYNQTVNDTANHLGVSERTVLRMIERGALLAIEATKQRWCRIEGGAWIQRDFPVNHGGFLVSDKSVRTAIRLRQCRGDLPRTPIPVTVEHLRGGRAPELEPWQEYQLVDRQGNRVDEYGRAS